MESGSVTSGGDNSLIAANAAFPQANALRVRASRTRLVVPPTVREMAEKAPNDSR